MRYTLILGIALCGIGLAGCGSSADESLVPVKGKVTFDGKTPLTTGIVILRPDASRGNTSKEEPRGPINAQGEYKIVTRDAAGAAPGWYKVTVVASRPAAGTKDPYALPTPLVHAHLSDFAKTRLGFEVKAGAPAGTYDLKVARP